MCRQGQPLTHPPSYSAPTKPRLDWPPSIASRLSSSSRLATTNCVNRRMAPGGGRWHPRLGRRRARRPSPDCRGRTRWPEKLPAKPGRGRVGAVRPLTVLPPGFALVGSRGYQVVELGRASEQMRAPERRIACIRSLSTNSLRSRSPTTGGGLHNRLVRHPKPGAGVVGAQLHRHRATVHVPIPLRRNGRDPDMGREPGNLTLTEHSGDRPLVWMLTSRLLVALPAAGQAAPIA